MNFKLISLMFEKVGWLPMVTTAVLSLLALVLLIGSFNTKRNSGMTKALLSVVVISVLIGLGLYGYFDWSHYTKSVMLKSVEPDSMTDPEELAETISNKLMTIWVYGFPAGLFTLLFLVRSLTGFSRHRKDKS